MIRSSHVSLLIPCEAAEAAEITSNLGVQPSEIGEDRATVRQPDDTMQEQVCHTWVLHSPMSAEAGDPTTRLWALVDLIRPFSERLVRLDAHWNRWIDIVYHVTPQYPIGVTGEFDWFRVPAKLMKLLAEWDLDVSYEVFWYNHPDWTQPGQSWWSRFRRRIGVG